jgi:superfamily II DNA or RNA helicase
MTEAAAAHRIKTGQHARLTGRPDLGAGEVLRVAETYGSYQADVVFETEGGRRLETVPLERLEVVADLWERAQQGDWDPPVDFLLKQLAFQFPLLNTGGQLSNSRTDLLPHQILLTRDVVNARRRRFLIADEVGLGKTIETGMIIRELVARGEAERILIIAPAGLTKNWHGELRDAFRLHFEILGVDFMDHGPASWEVHNRVIASIDSLKRPARMERLLRAPRWDVVVVDEAHHLSRIRYGNKIHTTQNYRLAEAIKDHSRDLLFLSATPHQGDGFQFWSLVSLLDEHLFDSPKAVEQHRELLSRVMFRRTKREVTDARGQSIFMRRQVNSQVFDQAARERLFYDRLTDYLREGYNVAGVGQDKTTTRQRAMGFVMATFQKLMSSSPRAITQALRKRLIVLLTSQVLDMEQQWKKSRFAQMADHILTLQSEIKQIAAEYLETRLDLGDRINLDGFVSQIRQGLTKKLTEETSWALDGEEEPEEEIYAESDIPNEAEKVRELITLVPKAVDRKFSTLARAIDELRRQNPAERFIIFTQYLETLAFLREELGRIYGVQKIALIRGGSLDEKIAAIEQFWKEDAARFLICTSAGGEGINLQVGRVLFNYDLPWNPMAVEQRIGRIHRYGQQETVQVYNIIARDTVEERIYGLLESKLEQIARTIGKIDPATGQPLEDFRSQILGFLGSSPNYQALYMKALVDKDYKRTEREIEEALQKAHEAAEALSGLTQDLGTFNLHDYLRIEGRVTLSDLRKFAEQSILRLGGAVLPNGEITRIEAPDKLQAARGVAPRYDAATFDRQVAMRKRQIELMGIGHPFIDALIAFLQGPRTSGEVTLLKTNGTSTEPRLLTRSLITVEGEARQTHNEVKIIQFNKDGQAALVPEDWDLRWLDTHNKARSILDLRLESLPWEAWHRAYESTVGALLTQARLEVDNPLAARVKLLGISVVV